MKKEFVVKVPEGLWKHALSLAVGTLLGLGFLATWIYSPDGNGYTSGANAPYFVYILAVIAVVALIIGGLWACYWLGRVIISHFIDME